MTIHRAGDAPESQGNDTGASPFRPLFGIGSKSDVGSIPDAYYDFVRTGDARKIKRILHHNRMDLLAMVGLFNCLVTRRTL
jgi:hypothetical protein